MQNISHVLSEMGLPWIKGLKPAPHVGSNVYSKIEEIIKNNKYFTNLLYESTSDPTILDARVKSLPNMKGKRPPKGKKAPQKYSSTSTDQFERDPEVKRWILDNTGKNCECCGKKPFIRKSDGSPYREVHHLRQLSHGGSDRTSNAVAICADCHREMHYGRNRDNMLIDLYKKINRLKPE